MSSKKLHEVVKFYKKSFAVDDAISQMIRDAIILEKLAKKLEQGVSPKQLSEYVEALNNLVLLISATVDNFLKIGSILKNTRDSKLVIYNDRVRENAIFVDSYITFVIESSNKLVNYLQGEHQHIKPHLSEKSQVFISAWELNFKGNGPENPLRQVATSIRQYESMKADREVGRSERKLTRHRTNMFARNPVQSDSLKCNSKSMPRLSSRKDDNPPPDKRLAR